VQHGLEMKNALATANDLYVDYNTFSNGNGVSQRKLESLPSSCWESADCLLEAREIFEKDGIFPSGVIENVVAKLKAFDDKDLSQRLFNKQDEIKDLVKQFLHCS
jgi:glutamine synthetase